jgi:hypothetical protein
VLYEFFICPMCARYSSPIFPCEILNSNGNNVSFLCEICADGEDIGRENAWLLRYKQAGNSGTSSGVWPVQSRGFGLNSISGLMQNVITRITQ